MRKRGVERGGGLDQMADDFAFFLLGQLALHQRQMRGERGEHCQLAGKGLGRGNTDFRPGMGGQQQVGLTRHAAGRHVDDDGNGLAIVLAMAQRSERIRRLARLRNEQRQPAFLQHRIAVAELACDIDIDGNAGEGFEPIFGDHPGVKAGAAGDDGDALYACQIEIHLRQGDGLFERADIAEKASARPRWAARKSLSAYSGGNCPFRSPLPTRRWW